MKGESKEGGAKEGGEGERGDREEAEQGAGRGRDGIPVAAAGPENFAAAP